MKSRSGGGYDPVIELAKGAKLRPYKATAAGNNAKAAIYIVCSGNEARR